jgi:5-methylcytosine-specific restriction endonuclease McrA
MAARTARRPGRLRPCDRTVPGRLGHLLPEDLRAIVERDGSQCIYCNRYLDYQARGNGDQHAASFDHIVRLTDGGSNTYENVACACRTCNQRNNSASIDDPESEALRRLRIFLSRKPGDTRLAAPERG